MYIRSSPRGPNRDPNWTLYNGAGARHLVRGSLKTWHVYIVVALLPSLAPHLDIFVIQHLFKPHRIRSRFGSESFVRAVTHLFKPSQRASVTGHPRDTLYAPTYFHRNIRSIRSAIFAISVAISALSTISVIFAIPKTSTVPILSTCWPSNQVPNIYQIGRAHV